MWNGVSNEHFPYISTRLMPSLPLLSFDFVFHATNRYCVRCLVCTSTLTWMATRRTAWWGVDLSVKTKTSDHPFSVRYCSINHYPCVLYDHECTGRSSKFGGNVWSKSWKLSVITMFWYDVYPQVNELQFSHWVEDVLAVVENLTDGPVVLVKA